MGDAMPTTTEIATIIAERPGIASAVGAACLVLLLALLFSIGRNVRLKRELHALRRRLTIITSELDSMVHSRLRDPRPPA